MIDPPRSIRPIPPGKSVGLVTELEKFQEMLIGISVAVGPGEGILGNLSYVAEIILRHSPNLSVTELETILENDKLSNREKARLLLTRHR